MPQIENVIQMKTRVLEGGRPNRVKHEKNTGGNEGILPRCRKTAKKAKRALSEYRRKPAVRFPSGKPTGEIPVRTDGKAAKPKPEKKRPQTVKASGLI